ncbi:cytochrome C oxidase subunit IV family protein [Roseobacter cerasinus]|uniref:cytochrome C oxidase subunit IV family protein n=1 Tax=Roseobacter cerasinus TaxID=2602289 RepID=UPI00135C8C92
MKYLRDPLTLVWLGLCVATVLSTIMSGQSFGSSRLSGLIVLGIAFAKAHLVIDHFMELRHAPNVWRAVLAAWIVLTFSVLGTLLLTSI